MSKRFPHTLVAVTTATPVVDGSRLGRFSTLHKVGGAKAVSNHSGRLYPNGLAERGGIRVELREDRLERVNGVIADVAGLLTGATQDTGFKGIGGRFDRRKLLFFGAAITGQMRFTRTDTGAAISVSARLDRVAADPRIPLLLPRCLAGAASADEAALFQSLWQYWVKTLLVERADDPDLIAIQNP